MLRGKRLSLLSAVLGVCCASSELAGGTVYLSVHSSLNEAVVQPSDTIDWAIEFSVSQGSNQGLALISVDFLQNKLNPEKFVMPLAAAVPAEMAGFNRPAGISSPGPGEYLGTQLGTDCYADLYCIGGAQNTFGTPGSSMGQDTDVDGGIGQSGTQTLASGTFVAPSTRGIYVFQIENAEANTLDSVNSPDPSPVSSASIIYQENANSFYIVVCPGDVTGDGEVGLDDLAALLAAYGSCVGDPDYDPGADLNSDGCVDIADLAILLANMNTVCIE